MADDMDHALDDLDAAVKAAAERGVDGKAAFGRRQDIRKSVRHKLKKEEEKRQKAAAEKTGTKLEALNAALKAHGINPGDIEKLGERKQQIIEAEEAYQKAEKRRKAREKKQRQRAEKEAREAGLAEEAARDPGVTFINLDIRGPRNAKLDPFWQRKKKREAMLAGEKGADK